MTRWRRTDLASSLLDVAAHLVAVQQPVDALNLVECFVLAEAHVGGNAQVDRMRDLAAHLARGGTPHRLAVEESVVTALAFSDDRSDRVRPRERSIAEAIAYVLEHDVGGQRSLSALALVAGVSVFHACRVFKRVMSVGIHRYHQEIRLRHALACLLETDRPIAQIALDCGFANQAHLTTLFRRRFLSTPARVRANGRPAVSDP